MTTSVDRIPTGKSGSRRREPSRTETPVFRYYGGHAALDLINTVSFRRGSGRQDLLGSVDDLVTWLNGAGLIDARSGAALRRWARVNETDARVLLRDMRRIRELAARLVEAAIERSRPSRRDMADVNALARKCSQRRIDWTGAGYGYRARPRTDLAGSIRQLCAESVVALLMSGDVRRIARCQDERGCGWLFIDNSRLGNRRWCSMSDCGNVAKARAFLRRGHLADGHSRH